MWWFIAVGTAAAALHWGVVVLAVRAGAQPLWANPLGWFVAFWASWGGHRHLTFAGGENAAPTSLWRFAIVSATGFAINEAAYAVLLRGAGLRYDIALAAVLAGVAVLTWLASRHWAFNGRPARDRAARDPAATKRASGFD